MQIGSRQARPTLGEKQGQKCDVKFTLYIVYGYIFGVKLMLNFVHNLVQEAKR